MIIANNGLITLDYDPATDILSVDLPDVRSFSLGEVERSLQILVDAIINYDIKKLFLDSSKAVVEVDDEAYRRLILKFSMDLMKTRLLKLARIGSAIDHQEQRANMVAGEIRQQQQLAIDFQNFRTRTEAVDWLLQTP